MTRMKESGIDWIGQIPEEWETSKIRYLVTTRSEKRITDSSVPYIGLENIESQTGKFVKTGIQVDKSENIVVEIGDVLFGKLRPYLRKYWRATFTSTASSEFLVFQSSELDMNFLYYAIQSDSFIEEVNTSTYGSKMPRASWEYIKNMRIAFPTSLVEQQKIADFLDKKTAQLDKVKSLLEEQIQKLKDYRASLIYETVTKGLDKNVPMKDSGIDWIGQIPQGWGVKPIKHVVATPVTDGPHETPLLCETGIPFLSAEAVKNGVLDFNYKRGYISLQDHERFKKKISPKKDDIFIVKSGATTGNVGIVNTDEIFDIWSPLALIRCKKSLAVQKYIYYYLISNIFKAQVEFNWSFGTQQNIGMGIIENIKLILPPLSEQTKISDLLDKKTYQIDQLIQIKNKQIDNINKQRQTLIYDYVTGKRRV
ncbi:restriction endonuclease subunit S [Streptococcus sp. KHUD_015]|uniref:restriction endonuclease subunit S n=1 Tax=Streptococcus sp. KHUD_015 TaxID=3434352 RepID=UPI003DA6CC57